MGNSPRSLCLLSLSISLSIWVFFAPYPPCKKVRKLNKLNKLKSGKTAFKNLAGLCVFIPMSLSSLFSLPSLFSLFSIPVSTPMGSFWIKQQTGIKKRQTVIPILHNKQG